MKDILEECFQTFGNSAKRVDILPESFSESDLEDIYKERRDWIDTLEKNREKSFTRIIVTPKDLSEYNYEIINNYKENMMFGERIYVISLSDYDNLLGDLIEMNYWIFDDSRVISIEKLGENYVTKEVEEPRKYIDLFNNLFKNSNKFNVVEK